MIDKKCNMSINWNAIIWFILIHKANFVNFYENHRFHHIQNTFKNSFPNIFEKFEGNISPIQDLSLRKKNVIS